MQKEIILLKYMSDLLSNGITDGIRKDDYNKLLNLIIDTINLSSFSTLKKERISNDEFNNIVVLANKLNKISKPGAGNAVEIKELNGKLYAEPTYSFTKNDKVDLSLEKIEIYAIKDYVSKKVNNIKLSSFAISDASSDDLHIGEIVSSYYVNDLIRRYVDDKINFGSWPKQCDDIDEYIFKRDIAKLIDEDGTVENFKIAYLQAIRVVCELINESRKKGRVEVYMSNNDYNMLAYANYKKIVNSYKLRFLRKYDYKKYEIKNESRSISIIDDVVTSSINTVINFLPYYNSTCDIESQKTLLKDNEDVNILRKRIQGNQS